MYSNHLEIIINAPIDKVWQALTNKEKIKEWMRDVVVETDWQEGSPICYKCFDQKGNIMTWNAKQMIWEGIIENIIPRKELTCFYPSLAEGLEKETYMLVEMFPEVTRIKLTQDCITKECALTYVDDTRHTLEKLKIFLEARY